MGVYQPESENSSGAALQAQAVVHILAEHRPQRLLCRVRPVSRAFVLSFLAEARYGVVSLQSCPTSAPDKARL